MVCREAGGRQRRATRLLRPVAGARRTKQHKQTPSSTHAGHGSRSQPTVRRPTKTRTSLASWYNCLSLVFGVRATARKTDQSARRSTLRSIRISVGRSLQEFIAHERNDGGAWPRRSTTPPPSPQRVYCSGTCDDQCGERIYAGERCGRCWSRRHKHSRGHDWEPGEWEEWIVSSRRRRKEEFVNFCARTAAHTAAVTAHQALGFTLEAKISVLNVRNMCFVHLRDQVGASAAADTENRLCAGAGVCYSDFGPLFRD